MQEFHVSNTQDGGHDCPPTCQVSLKLIKNLGNYSQFSDLCPSTGPLPLVRVRTSGLMSGLMAMTLGYGTRGRRFEAWWSHNKFFGVFFRTKTRIIGQHRPPRK